MNLMMLWLTKLYSVGRMKVSANLITISFWNSTIFVFFLNMDLCSQLHFKKIRIVLNLQTL